MFQGHITFSDGLSAHETLRLPPGGHHLEPSASQTAKMAEASTGTLLSSYTGTTTFTPGIYHASSGVNFQGNVTLDGLGQANPKFIFRSGTTITTNTDIRVTLINGANRDNVLWVAGTAVTIGTYNILEGSILAGTAITFGLRTHLHGCALALDAFVGRRILIQT
jgi:hypothetical protein